MPTPTIPAGNLFMNATLYTGTSATQVITNGAPGASFQPDFTWFKSRNAVNEHILVDSVRGVNQDLFSSTTNAEATVTDRVLSFNSNGVTVGVDAARGVNYAGQTQVVWQWKAGGTAVSNTAGSITSSVSANTTAGFSVVTWTGNGSTGAVTLGHGLGVAPSMVILKSRTTAGQDWLTYHVSVGNTKGLYLQSTAAATTNSAYWNNTDPTSTVFTTTGNTSVSNQSGQNYVTYCFAPIAGYSAFGSYTGNGSATSGAFIYTGFRPRFVMIKRTDSTSSWIMIDSSRDPYNLAGQGLQANSSAAELTPASSGYPIDLLSNGFKLYETGDPNVSSGTYVYACFAENPFKYSNAR